MYRSSNCLTIEGQRTHRIRTCFLFELLQSFQSVKDLQSFRKQNLTPRCNALFCSNVCFNFALKGSEGSNSDVGWHNFTCVEVLGSLRTEQYFLEQDACQLATIILAKSISKVSASPTEIDREIAILSSRYSTDKLEIPMSDKFEKENGINHLMLYQNSVRQLRTRAFEFRPLLEESWLSKLGEFSSAIQKFLEQEFFLKLVTGIQVCVRAIEVDPSDNTAGIPDSIQNIYECARQTNFEGQLQQTWNNEKSYRFVLYRKKY